LESYLKNGNICAIVYSNPNNPAWICLNEQELQAIGQLATKYDAIVMEDLAYFAMDFRKNLSVPFQPPYQPTVGRYTDNYMLLISGSKAFSYAGERIGVVCISNKLFHRHYDDLAQRYEGLPFGLVFSTRMLYALSSGTSHSAQYALAAMLKAATDGTYDFRKEVSVYGERAHKLKEIFLRHGFHIVYDKDLDEPVADGFYFTIGYKKMTSGELAKELMYYGVSAICLITTGSHQEGLRVCTSFIEDHQYAQLEERMTLFEANNP
jgi:aspartate/methionine/tyrosine aminotransferase